MLDSKLVDSTSQARRDINSNAVSINQEKISDDKLNLTSGEYILQKGKKSFAKNNNKIEEANCENRKI